MQTVLGALSRLVVAGHSAWVTSVLPNVGRCADQCVLECRAQVKLMVGAVDPSYDEQDE